MSHFFLRVVALIFVMFVVIGFGGAVIVSSASAQEISINDSDDVEEEDDVGERIDRSTVLLDYGIDESRGTGWVEIRSEVRQKITISDAGAFIEGGEIATSSTIVPEGEETRISVPVTEVDGFVGVSISASEEETLYAVPMRSPGGVSLPAESAGLALVMGSISTFSVITGYRRYRKRKKQEGVVRCDGG